MISNPKKLVILGGGTGVGKSTLGNIILGYEAFKTGASFCEAVTKISEHKKENFYMEGNLES